MTRTMPRLSQDLPGPMHPERCQSCGIEGEEGLGSNPLSLTRWQECDDQDRRENIIVVLCRSCSDRLVEAHPRLYHALAENQPWPGCMAICAECRFREGPRCTHPDLKDNGGTGLRIVVSKPTVMFLDGTDKSGRRRGWTQIRYELPPRDCAGHEEQPDKTLLTAAGTVWQPRGMEETD